MARDYTDKQYKIFRSAVRNRDKKCRWPGCNCKKKLQVHHIMPWSDYHHLRYEPTNGITLCKMHHGLTRGKELEYASFFMGILNGF